MSSVFSLSALSVPVNSGAPSLWVEDKDGGYVDLSPEWFDGHPDVSTDALDVPAFSDGAHRTGVGLQDASLSFSFLLSSGTAGTSAYDVCRELARTNTTARSLLYYPKKLADSELRFPAVRCVSVVVDGEVGEALTFDAEFAIDGTYSVKA